MEMNTRSPEEEKRKRAIFESMSSKRQQHILKKGYDDWNPFLEPKDPIDIRKDKTRRTTQVLVREFLQTQDAENYSNDFGRGVLEICLGIVNGDERYLGMFEFSKWYHNLLEKDGFSD
jgi:hypothetical protein